MKDTIYREDAIGACAYETIECYEARKAIRALPSADRPSAVDLSSVYSTAYKSGYEKGKADRPQGEWIDAEIPLESGGSMPIQVCNLCKTFYPLAHTGGGYHFCPNCGSRMKGADDE